MKFQPPTLEQIQHYCLLRRNQVDPEAWLDYYLSCGFVVGGSRKPMKDWKAAVRLWERNQKQWKTQGNAEQEFINKHTERGWAE